jgi:hypothetical protein
MPPVEVLTEASGRDPDAELPEYVPSEMIADGGAATDAPVRSVRRATARRASHRRATARTFQDDNNASIIEFLAQHPESTAGDLAKGLNLDPGTVATHLNQLAKTGEIEKASHGYAMTPVTRPPEDERPLPGSD